MTSHLLFKGGISTLLFGSILDYGGVELWCRSPGRVDCCLVGPRNDAKQLLDRLVIRGRETLFLVTHFRVGLTFGEVAVRTLMPLAMI